VNSEKLKLENNFSDADAFYKALIDRHRNLDREQSERFNARLILILANQIGDLNALEEALEAAARIDTSNEEDQ
jgi:hypothetical protein